MTMVTTPVSNGSNANTTTTRSSLAEQYPVHTVWELKLENQEVVSGRVYCTDELSQSVVLQHELVHTTLAVSVRIIQASSIVEAHQLQQPSNEDDDSATSTSMLLMKPLAKISKKMLEDRERKALKAAEESFRHINHKATPKGQACFERLLKACNQVTWKEESIVVLHAIQVDPPYTSENCKIIARNITKKEEGSLDRVKKIVAAADETTTTTAASTAASSSILEATATNNN